MKMKRIFLLLATLLAVGTTFGQQKINAMVDEIERWNYNPPRPNSIEIRRTVERAENGKVVRSWKEFIIRDIPNLVDKLAMAFENDREFAELVTESIEGGSDNPRGKQSSRKISKRYFFVNGRAGVLCSMNGTGDEMMFSYIYSDDAESLRPVRSVPEERVIRLE